MHPVKPTILNSADCIPRVDATVELISRVQRPYLFRVTCVGKPPHVAIRQYEIQGRAEWDAAKQGIDRFVREFSRSPSILDQLVVLG